MTKNIEPKLKSINEYLKLDSGNNFVIPEYQRGYSWDIDRCDKLFTDIENFGGDDPYFFGTIIIDCSIQNKMRLIDGQQRTTTFILLAKALYLRINEKIDTLKNKEDDETKSLLEGLKERRKTILKVIYNVEAEDVLDVLKNPVKLKERKNNIENNSINELHKDELNTILDHNTFDEIELNTTKIPRKKHDNKYTRQFRNFKFFYEKLNKDSTEINKFAKTFLEKCQIIEIKSWDVEQAIVMFNTLNSDALPLSDTDIISAQLYAKAENKEDFNKQWEEINKIADELNSKKISDLDKILNQYMYIHRAKNNLTDVTLQGLRKYYLNNLIIDEKLCEKIEKILENWNSVTEKSIVKLALKFNENIRTFLSCYLFGHNNFSDKELTGVCECLIRLFAVMEVVDAGYSTNNFKQFLFNENVKFTNSEIKINEIIEDFSRHINEKWKQEEIEEKITEYDKNVLVYLNEYLYAKERGLGFDFQEKTNVEHIMPASGKNISTIRTDANLEKEEFDDLVNSIGNKILLEENINKSIGRDWFKTKTEKYKKSEFGIAKKLSEKEKWQKDDIENATQKASKRIVGFIFASK
jgi:uncharacterized protein with ParB-like and HNH nuclease domain